MRRAILYTAVPAVSAMVNWSPASLHLPASLEALLRPISALREHQLLPAHSGVRGSLPLAEAQTTKEDATDDVDGIIVVVSPTIDRLLTSDTQLNDKETEEQIEDADTTFLLPTFLPPPPSVSKGDLNAPISSHTSIPDLLESLAAKLIIATSFGNDDSDASESEYLSDEYLPVTDNEPFQLISADESSDTVEEVIALEETSPSIAEQLATDNADPHNYIHHHGFSHAVKACLHNTYSTLHPATTHLTHFLVPSSTLQWLVFSFSFTLTLLIILLRTVVLRRRWQRMLQTKTMEWEKMQVGGVEVGIVQKRTLRRGEGVWIVVEGERMEKVWLEGEVGVRGKEVWHGQSQAV